MLKRDEGVASIAALALMGVLLLATFLGVAIAQQASAREHLSRAADVAALAGAQSLADPCRAAHDTAASNATELVECDLSGGDVMVRLRARMPPLTRTLLEWLGHEARDLEAAARAGPPD